MSIKKFDLPAAEALLKEYELDQALADVLRIEAESSYQEAVIVGSRDGFLRAAFVFLQIAVKMKAGEHDEFDEALEVKPLFSEYGAVWPVATYVTDSEIEAEEFASKFRPAS